MHKKHSFFSSPAVQTVLSSLLCIVIGLFLGYIILLLINPKGANQGILTILKNYFTYSRPQAVIKYFGNTLVKTAPLLMCALSICFCYKVGLFNIGAAGQYTIGTGAALYLALALNMPWYICLLGAMVAGALLGGIIGLLKAHANVNEVISGIMLNWIMLYCVNTLLTGVKESASPYTIVLSSHNSSALLPTLGLTNLLRNEYASIAIPLSVIIAIVLWIVLNKTKFGYELKATGYNKNAAKYAGMKEKHNIVITLMIGGALAGIGAGFLYLTGFEQWATTQTSVPSMGFNGIAATFLGGLHPIGTIFSSYFIQHITLGGSYLDKTMYSSQISDLITAIIIYLCSFVLFFKHVIRQIGHKKGDKQV